MLLSSKWVRLAWEDQSPVVRVVRTFEPYAMVTYSTIVVSAKISYERPNAWGFRLKYPSMGTL